MYLVTNTFIIKVFKSKKIKLCKLRKWLNQVKEKCPEVKFKAHYALLGRYDFLDIYEAPDDETAAKVSFISQANGASSSESLAAIPYKRFLEITKEIS